MHVNIDINNMNINESNEPFTFTGLMANLTNEYCTAESCKGYNLAY